MQSPKPGPRAQRNQRPKVRLSRRHLPRKKMKNRSQSQSDERKSEVLEATIAMRNCSRLSSKYTWNTQLTISIGLCIGRRSDKENHWVVWGCPRLRHSDIVPLQTDPPGHPVSGHRLLSGATEFQSALRSAAFWLYMIAGNQHNISSNRFILIFLESTPAEFARAKLQTFKPGSSCVGQIWPWFSPWCNSKPATEPVMKQI